MLLSGVNNPLPFQELCVFMIVCSDAGRIEGDHPFNMLNGMRTNNPKIPMEAGLWWSQSGYSVWNLFHLDNRTTTWSQRLCLTSNLSVDIMSNASGNDTVLIVKCWNCCTSGVFSSYPINDYFYKNRWLLILLSTRNFPRCYPPTSNPKHFEYFHGFLLGSIFNSNSIFTIHSLPSKSYLYQLHSRGTFRLRQKIFLPWSRKQLCNI